MNAPIGWIDTGVEDHGLRAYMETVLRDTLRIRVTSLKRYQSWGELPWDPAIGPPKPLPLGSCVLIGMRDRAAAHGAVAFEGPENWLVIADGPWEGMASFVAAQVAIARGLQITERADA